MTIPVAELVFVDTNVLLAATDEDRSSHDDAQTVLERCRLTGRHLALNQQVIREYLVVATRPVNVNGLGLKPDLALENVDQILRFVNLLDDEPATLEVLLELVQSSQIKGKRIHDAAIVASMAVHGIDWIVTDNPMDFQGILSGSTISIRELAALVSVEPPTR